MLMAVLPSLFQFIIGEDGAFGNNASHSCTDGTIGMALTDYVSASM